MPVEYEIEDDLIRLISGGEFTHEEFHEALKQAKAQPRPGGKLDILIVDTGSSYNPSDEMIRDAGLALGRELPIHLGRMALVVSQDLHYGIGRMLQVFAEEAGAEFQVFRQELKARLWLSGRRKEID